MYYKKISAPVIFFFFSFFFLQSCSDDSMSPSNSSVNGKVLGSANNPLPNLKIKIGNQSTVTGTNGDFSLSNISMPYDLLIIDEQSKSQALIKSVNIQNITVPEFLSFKNPDFTSYLNVNIPSEFLQAGKKGKIIFTNGVDINSSKDIVSESTDLEIKMSEFKRLNGKLIILIYKTDNAGNIISYENYCEINEIEIFPNRISYYNIDSTQLSFNPGERSVSGKINIPPGYTSGDQYFYLNFASKNSSFNNDECKFSAIDGNDFNIIVPVDLPSEFSVLIHNYIHSGSGNKYCLETFIVPDNSGTVEFQSRRPADLNSPAENETNVNSNTEISYTSGDGNGVFVTRFFKDSYICSVVTTSGSFSFSELNKFEIGDMKNSYFVWSVQKYGEVSGLNEYLTSYPLSPDRFLSKAEQRIFRTAP